MKANATAKEVHLVHLQTSYEYLNRKQATAVLFALVAATDWCLLHDDESSAPDVRTFRASTADTELYRAVTQRVRGGDGYYQAATVELVSRGYPVTSVFHWRPPVYAWIFGRLPSPAWGRAILLSGCIAAIALSAFELGRAEGATLGTAVGAALTGSYAWLLFPSKEYNMEIWSGILIMTACVFRVSDRWFVGVVAGSLALLLRELALPFCATALLVAVWSRRFLEASCWGVVLCAGAVLFYLHWKAVNNCVSAITVPSGAGWMQFGGTAFVLATCRINFILAALPSWCAAVYLPLALLGLAGWSGRRARLVKLTVAVYLLLFMFVGRPANFYWGWLNMPLLVLGIARAPASLSDLMHVMILPVRRTSPHD